VRILESAVLGSTGQALGATVWGQQYLGSRFHISYPTRLTTVGGHLANDSDQSLFAAIIRLGSPFGLPTFPPRSIESSALAHVLFTPPRPSGDVLIPLSVALDPGDYALVFGGADSAVNFLPFGATGTGVMPLNNGAFPTSSYVLGDASRWTSDDTSLARARFVVEGDLSAAAVPSAPTGLRTS
jgi:hypothetical protein